MKTPSDLRRITLHRYSDILEIIDNRLRKLQVTPPRRRDPLARRKTVLLARLATIHNVLRTEAQRLVEALQTLLDMHPFYHMLYEIEVGETPRETLRLARSINRMLGRLYREYRARIAGAGSIIEANHHYREAVGRMLSLYRRRRRLLDRVAGAIKTLGKTPDVTGDIHVVIAGVPQVGKSTLLSRLSRARPEIAPYPFTTKTIIVGHIETGGQRIVLIDTPGLLDRPLDEKNPIEKKAVAAIKTLAEKTLYLFDASPNSYYTLEEQLNVYRWVRSAVGGDILVCVNKVDITPPRNIVRLEEMLGEEIRCRISALTGQGLDYVKEWISRGATENNPPRGPSRTPGSRDHPQQHTPSRAETSS